MNLTWCHNRLAIGSSSELDSGINLWNQFESIGITHVINCRRDPDYHRHLEVIKGLVMLWNPTDDDGQPKPVVWFAKSIDFALGAFSSPRNKVAVVCCEGNNRSPSTALAILMAQGLGMNESLTRILAVRPGAQIRYAQDAEAAVKELGYA